MMQMRITSETAAVCHGGISLLDIQRQSGEPAPVAYDQDSPDLRPWNGKPGGRTYGLTSLL